MVEDSVPADVTLVEPSKLRAEDVTKLWQHWRGRQKDGVRAVVFAEALAKDIRPHGDDAGWPRKKGKSKAQIKGKRAEKGKGSAKGKGKAKYVEVDDSSESSSDDSSNESSSSESSESSSEEGEVEDAEDYEGEPIKTGWGPARVPAKRPKVQLITQAGGSGLSHREKGALRPLPAEFPTGRKGGKKNSKNALQPIPEYEHAVSAENNSDVEQGASAERISQKRRAGSQFIPGDVEMAAPEMHPGSPAACNVVPEDRFSYLKNLSTNHHYRDLLNMIQKDEVCLVFHHHQQYFN